ncbi:MAG TPA: hypothetical protein PKH77_09355 [Anaerolineae bacterium]|nr:hypothetical protein [Anaerolineae bacterium]
MDDERLQWLLTAPEPWTRYRVLVDLLDRPADDAEVVEARAVLLAHPQVQALVAAAATWGQRPLVRHNDAGHPLYALSTLADFGLRADDPGMATVVAYVLAHWAPEGAWQSLVNVPKAFGGAGEDQWTWLACDAPTLLYALLSFGLDSDPRMPTAVAHLADTVEENGWRCAAAPELGKFKGPGRRTDPCPIANVYALKALSLVPELRDSAAAHAGAEMLLDHWMRRGTWRPFLFGIGGDFRKLKYPFIWYDILHVVEVLSRFPFVWADARFQEMLAVITAQADAQGRYTASSMYRAWQGWSFADKKQPSPWLTFLVLRILKRET